jgi:UrcA family protein
MKISSASTRLNELRRLVPAVFAVGALALVSSRAHAADPEEIDMVTIPAVAVKTIGRDTLTGAPVEKATVSARVQFDPVTLTTNSGVSLLRVGVLEAARKACAAALAEDNATCVRQAIQSAQPQVDATIIAHARSTATG